MKILKMADKTLNKLLVVFILIDIVLVIGNFTIKKIVPDRTKEYMLEVEKYITELEGNGYTDVYYEKNIYNNILSVAIYGTNGIFKNSLQKVYNINIDTKEKLTLNEVLYIFGIDESSFQKQYIEGYLSFFDTNNESYLDNVRNSDLSDEDKNSNIESISIIRNEIQYVDYNTNVYNKFFIKDNEIYIYADNARWRDYRNNDLLKEDIFAYEEINIK